MRKIAGETKPVASVHHFENRHEVRRLGGSSIGWLVNHTWSENIFRRQPPQPRRRRAQGLEILLHPPDQMGQPAEAALDQHYAQSRKTLEQALAHHTGEMRLVGQRQRGVPLEVTRGPAHRRGRRKRALVSRGAARTPVRSRRTPRRGGRRTDARKETAPRPAPRPAQNARPRQCGGSRAPAAKGSAALMQAEPSRRESFVR